jgi:hypothetical protein
MKIYVHEKGIVIAGKAWEIRQKLIEYRRQYELVKDWIEAVNKKSS